MPNVVARILNKETEGSKEGLNTLNNVSTECISC